MSFWGKLFGGGAASLVDSVGQAADSLFTSDEERAQWEAVKIKLAVHAAEIEAGVDRAMLAHRSLFVAGGRPFILWVAGLGLLYEVLARPLLSWYLVWDQGAGAILPPGLSNWSLEIIAWVAAGMGAIREVNKWRGVEK